jgi:hypothetical protein
LAEDHALPWRDHFPERGKMTVLPAVAEELAHGGLVFIAGEELLGTAGVRHSAIKVKCGPSAKVNRRMNPGATASRPVSPAAASQKRFGSGFFDEGRLQDQHRTRRLRPEVTIGSFLYAQHRRNNADPFDGCHCLDRRCRWRLSKKLEHCVPPSRHRSDNK